MSETSGSPTRGARSLDGGLLTLELDDVLGQLDRESEGSDEPRTSMTVVHRPDLRVVVSRLRDGATIADEASDEDVVIMTIEGDAEVEVDGRTGSLRQGTLASIASGCDWTLRGREETVAVLVFGPAALGGSGEVSDATSERPSHAATDRRLL
jgi:quercetin dioxygenase-like cupin family protein